MKLIDKYLSLTSKINYLLEKICIVMIVIMTTIIWIQVFNRYVLGFSFIWVEEVAKVLMIYTAMFGAAILMFEDGHVSVTFILDKISFEYWIRAFFLVLIILFSAVLAYSGYIYTIRTTRSSWMTGISYKYYHVSMLIGGFFLITQSIGQLLKITKEKFTETSDASEKEESI